MRPAWTLAAAAALAACAGDPGADDRACADDAAVLTWDNFGQGFVVTNCQGCHASTAADRHGAPEGVVFDTRDDVIGRADRVLAVVAGEPPTMPPGGGVSGEDRRKITRWLSCFEAAR